MKRGTLVIAFLLLTAMSFVIMPVLVVLWLLGSPSPFLAYDTFLKSTIYGDNN